MSRGKVTTTVKLHKTVRGSVFLRLCQVTSTFQDFIAKLFERLSYSAVFWLPKTFPDGVVCYEVNGEKAIHRIMYSTFLTIWGWVAFINGIRRLDSTTQTKLVMWSDDLPLIGYMNTKTQRSFTITGNNYSHRRATGGLMWILASRSIGAFQRAGDNHLSDDGSYLKAKFVWISGELEGRVFELPAKGFTSLDDLRSDSKDKVTPKLYYRPYSWVVGLFQISILGFVLKLIWDHLDSVLAVVKKAAPILESLFWRVF